MRGRREPVHGVVGQVGGVDVKELVQRRLLEDLGPGESFDLRRSEDLRMRIDELFNQILMEENIVLARHERRRLHEQIVAELLGYGPIEPLLDDPEVTEIMTVGHDKVYVERKGLIEEVPVHFESEEHLRRIIDRIVAPLGRRIDESSPLVDARLPDGSRVNAVIPPIAIDGSALTIRKFSKVPLTVQDIINFGSTTVEQMEFMRACVIAGFNIVVSGGTGSGKTTLLNILSSFIPANERIVTIENAAELQLRQEHVVRLESRPPNIEGKGEITIRDLVINSLRMRPDRIIVGEVRGGEALDLVQAMNTGHDGSMGTAHSNSPRDTIARLETMCLMAGMDLPVRAIREQIASAIHLICHQDRLRDGSRKITRISEVQGMEGNVVTMSDIFVFEQTGMDGTRIVGRIKPTGLRPKNMDRILDAGIQLPPSVFGIGRR
ncbi:MAG TPA: CpaF family protein [Aggregatilineales bacterium]|nr:CpaF family protein [Aggregatilineales bacterium]HQE18207.1 CpaF family protein [Aggregatilineales bacterium]